jgi:hypothetical protein
VRERGATVERDVLNGEQEFPERLRHVQIFAPQGKQKINRENHKVGRQDPQSAAGIESWQIQTVIAGELRQKLAANQISTKNKEKVYADPTPPMDATRQRKTHDAGVINDDDDDCQCPEEIETGLPLSVLEPRIEINLNGCSGFAPHTKK